MSSELEMDDFTKICSDISNTTDYGEISDIDMFDRHIQEQLTIANKNLEDKFSSDIDFINEINISNKSVNFDESVKDIQKKDKPSEPEVVSNCFGNCTIV